MKLKFLSLGVILSFLFLTIIGCDNPTNSSSDSDSDTVGTKTGFFIDGPVKGLEFKTSSGVTGTTDSNGSFTYNDGDDITFYIADMELGQKVECSDTITPLNLCDTTDLANSSSATNLVRLLLSLDTGENPYGLTLPDDIHDKLDLSSNNDLNDVLEMSEENFKSSLKEIYNDVTGDNLADSDIPSDADAQDHFNASIELVESLEAAAETENMFLSVSLPEDKTGSVFLSYSIEELPEGITSYISGKSGYAIDGVVSYTEEMLPGNWIMTISMKNDSTQMSVGDILSFYTDNGFSSTIPDSYPLVITEDSPALLQASLSTDGAVIDAVHEVSGTVTIPKIRPGDVDIMIERDDLHMTIFLNILHPVSGEGIGSFSVSPDITSTSFIDDGENYIINYSTYLPAGYNLESQLYLSAGSNQEGDIVDWFTLGTITGAVTDCNYSGSWDDNRSIKSTSKIKMPINDNMNTIQYK